MSVDEVPWQLLPPACRLCGTGVALASAGGVDADGSPVSVVLVRTDEGWQCADGVACGVRQAAQHL